MLVMSKRRIAQRYLRTYFVLDIWCALPFDRLVLPALVEVAPPQKPLKCAPGSSDMLLVDCLPRAGGRYELLGRALGYVPRVLSFAKGRGRLRQVLVGAPTIVGHVRRFFRLLRASRVRLVKWRALAVLGRRYRKNAKAYFNRLPSPSFTKPKAASTGGDADAGPRNVARTASDASERDEPHVMRPTTKTFDASPWQDSPQLAPHDRRSPPVRHRRDGHHKVGYATANCATYSASTSWQRRRAEHEAVQRRAGRRTAAPPASGDDALVGLA